MGRDSLSSWLRSVQEAKRHQEIFRSSLSKLSGKFFKRRKSTSNEQTTSRYQKANTDGKENQPQGNKVSHTAVNRKPHITPLDMNLQIHELDYG
jgi:hypothetical protein